MARSPVWALCVQADATGLHECNLHRLPPGTFSEWRTIHPVRGLSFQQRRFWASFAVVQAPDTLDRHYNSSFMAAGDAQRVWFPEVIERLRSQWHEGMPCDELIGLRDDLDAMLQRIRSDRHIRLPVFRCPECGHVGEGAAPHISVRAMILSLLRFGIAPAEKARPLEKAWAEYRKQKGTDVYGVASMVNEAARCDHAVSGKD